MTEQTSPAARRYQTGTQVDEALAAAQAAIAEGRCIVLPTDTVYGIGADAFSAEAVQGLLDAKQRGRDMPPPVLVAETGMVEALAEDVPASAMALAEAFWPGALTLILPAQRHLRIDLGDAAGTIAVRVPDHDFTRDLLRRTGPLAVSSANVSGQPAGTSVDQAQQQLGDAVAVYLDAGPTPGPTPSTIIDFVSEPMGRVVRLGALSVAQLREVAPFVVDPDEERADPVEPEPLEAGPVEAEPLEVQPVDQAATGDEPVAAELGEDPAGSEESSRPDDATLPEHPASSYGRSGQREHRTEG